MSVEQSHENILEYIQFLFKKIFEFNKKCIISIRKMRNSGNSYSDYGHLFFGKDF